MRRIAVLFSPLLLAALALAGCGSSGPSAATGTGASAKVTVSGAFDKQPTVTIPHARAGSALFVHTVIHGSGAKIDPKTEAVVGDYAVYLWRGTTATLKQSTYRSAPALFAGPLLPGLESALQDAKIGSRVLAVIPPKEGYGSQGNSQAGVEPTDTLVFVVDLIKSFPNDASASGKTVSGGGHGLPVVTAQKGGEPTVKIPHATPPAKLVTQTLIKGSGSPVTRGQSVVVQYEGVIWRNGTVFSSSWKNGAPLGFVIGTNPPQVIPGWDTGLLGVRVGSRVMLVVPPKDGYGSAGNSQAGIKGTDTLVFVVDILGAFSAGAAAA